MAGKWISRGYCANLVLSFVGLAPSTYYACIARKAASTDATAKPERSGPGPGRPKPGYSITRGGKRIPDELISEWLCELVSGDGFPYGYRKLTEDLRDAYQLIINPKKVYSLCKQLDILQPQRRIRFRHPRRLARREVISGPNQLWEMDMKYGSLGDKGFFFQLSLIDVFDRSVIMYHLGRSCTAEDACRVLKRSLELRGLSTGILPKLRSDNGPQFVAHIFEDLCVSLGVVHERIPVRTPNMNAHIEAFHSILESECYSRHEFTSFLHAYSVITDYMEYYNRRRRHGSLKYKSPSGFYDAVMAGKMRAKPFAA